MKAKKWLDDHHIDYTERHIKGNNPSAAELKTWHEQSGLPLKKFLTPAVYCIKVYSLKINFPV